MEGTEASCPKAEHARAKNERSEDMDPEYVILIFLRTEHSDYFKNSETVKLSELVIYSIASHHVCLGTEGRWFGDCERQLAVSWVNYQETTVEKSTD